MAMSGTGFGEPTPADDLLVEMLGQAVPMLIEHLQQMPADARHKQILAWREGAAREIAETGDGLRFGAKSGQPAKAFSVLARGVAVLACCPGGVSVFGRHWCADHGLCEQAQVQADRLPGLEAVA